MLYLEPFRLTTGGRVDRTMPRHFEFDGQRYRGCQGDTLASALLANGVHLLARSFKYHRPRGILTAGSEEPNALVQLESGARTEPNLRATQVELYEGLCASSQNRWPSLRHDVGQVNDALKPLLPAGFYYKTFMWPKSGWMHYERLIRRAAGLGVAPREPDPDHYDKVHLHCELLIVGAGPAGLCAALAAARTGVDVAIVDEQAEPGGTLLAEPCSIDDASATDWLARTVAELASLANVRFLSRTTALGYFDHNYLTLAERCTDHLAPRDRGDRVRQRLWKVRAGHVLLATGAHERPLVFANNDRPGIMLAGAAATYAVRYAVRAGQRVIVATNNSRAYASAFSLATHGADVRVLDARPEPPRTLLDLAARHRVEVRPATVPVRAHGRLKVKALEFARIDSHALALAGTVERQDCDLVAVSGGYNPAVHLFSHSRGSLSFDDAQACFVPDQSFPGQSVEVVGAAAGCFDLARILPTAHAAGVDAARRLGRAGVAPGPAPSAEPGEPLALRPIWEVPDTAGDAPGRKHFVDFQNDVTAADLRLAASEGYRSIEHLKRYTTTGMGTDQGKTSNVNALAIHACTLGEAPAAVGTTTFRPPYTPVTFGTLAGRDVGALMDPVRLTPMHHWHADHGAVFENVGQWKRPWYYPREGESMPDAVNRECLAARRSIGLLDASTLGKIELAGPDAATLLNRVYTNGFSKLAVGRARYGLMCHEDGMVFDDGVTVRLATDRFLMHTTTGGAARVLAWLEEWLQTEWPELEVYCTSVTEQYATAAISGPRARELLALLTSDIDLTPEAFPFMSLREGHVAGIPARVIRVSFTGELCFEVTVDADHGLTLWETLMRAGARFGITPFGTETMHVLRAEKGFIIVGQDTDGTVTPVDLGLGGMVSRHKDFLGKRSLSRPDTARTDRKQLIGLLTDAATEVLPEGAQAVEVLRDRPPMAMIGHVTSSYFSANLGRSIALGLIRDGRNRLGERIAFPLEHRTVHATVVEPVFFDPEGGRTRG